MKITMMMMILMIQEIGKAGKEEIRAVDMAMIMNMEIVIREVLIQEEGLAAGVEI
jgi:hypothetical protein